MLSEREEERWAVWEERIEAGDFSGACRALIEQPTDTRKYAVCDCADGDAAVAEAWWARHADIEAQA